MPRGSMRLYSEGETPRQKSICHNLELIFTTHPCLYGITFISIITLDIAEATNDWLFFSDIANLHQGLVYGPIKPLLLLMLLLFSGVGTLIFVFEVLNLVRNILRGKPWLDLDLVSTVVIWLNEGPLVSILFSITMCHSEPVSYFQLTKALLVIISVLFRIINPLIRTYIKRQRMSGNEKFRNSIYKVLITVGSALLLCGSATIFIFSHVVSTDRKGFEVRLPHEIWGGKKVYDTYFTDVGIYFNHKELRFMNQNQQDKQWIKFSNIHEFYTTDSFDVKFIFTERGNYIEKFILTSYNASKTRYTECYRFFENLNKYSLENCTADYIVQKENPGTFTFKFLFIRPTAQLILGNIEYNTRYKRQHVCHQMWANHTDLFQVHDDEHQYVGELLYLKHQPTMAENARLVDGITHEDTSNLLFSTDHTLIEAEDMWKTGMFECDCTGKHGPKMNPDLQVSC